jgi:hypothetical protein
MFDELSDLGLGKQHVVAKELRGRVRICGADRVARGKEVAVTKIVEHVAKHGSSSNPKTAAGQALVRLKKDGLVDSPSRDE